jgi:hypothetical protein
MYKEKQKKREKGKLIVFESTIPCLLGILSFHQKWKEIF